jgi:peptide deformylase
MSTPSCRLVLHPDPVLRAKAAPVEAFDDALRGLAEEMIQLRKEHQGIGLAAPQAGHSIRMFVCNTEEEGEEEQIFVNPEILEASGDLEWSEEGCLSLPEIRGSVRRPIFVRIRAQDLDGEHFELESDGLHARVWLHENDHLDGVLILDRMRPLDRLANRRALKELESMNHGG